MARVRAIVAIAYLVLVTSVALPLQMLAVRFNWPLARSLPVWWHGFALRRLGVRLQVTGAPAIARPLLVTPNHTSWLDISIIASLLPVSFVAKSEVAGWPVFGLFARLQRCVFVDRNRRAATGKVASEIGHRLANGDAMVLFPEGTSSDGVHVLGFRSALIGAAHEAIVDGYDRAWVQPLSIAYTRVQGLPLGRTDRPRLAWYGDMDLFPHLWGAFLLGAVDIAVTWGEPIAYDRTTDRKLIAAALERTVRSLTVAALTGRPAEIAGVPATPEPAGLPAPIDPPPAVAAAS